MTNMGTTVPDYVADAIKEKSKKVSGGITPSKYIAHVLTAWVDEAKALVIKEGA